MIELNALLDLMMKKDASDLYLTAGAAPTFKVNGHLHSVGDTPLPDNAVNELAHGIMNDEQKEEFEHNLEMNLAISRHEAGRFRVNIYQQRNEVGMVIRAIKMDIPSADDLGVPPILNKLIMEKRGLILLVGATSSGKSTTLASMIDHRNTNSDSHIITIEDPIEFVHQHKKSIITQREVGIDTQSYHAALENTLRQAPDVILIGEIRTRDTMEHAIAFAETGHLCISTLHANNANQALDRIINFFPEERRNQLLLDLSLNLVSVISQRLIPSLDGKRALAMEILLGSPYVKDLIRKGEVELIKEAMKNSTNLGMQTFDNALFELYRDGKISQAEALKNADSENDLRLQISMAEGVSEEGKKKIDSLTIEKDDDEKGGNQKPGEIIND